MKVILPLLLFCSLGFFFSANAQCLQGNAPEINKIEAQKFIFIGKSIASKSERFDDGHIYTIHTISVKKTLKGLVSTQTLEVITRGGVIDLEMEVVTPSVEILPEHDYFFAMNNIGIAEINADEIFDVNLNISISTYLCAKYDIHPDLNKRNKNTSLPIILNLNKTNIPAGTEERIRISGLNFGSSRGNGYVEFKNADAGSIGYISPLASQYIVWSDTLIEVFVPHNAGTGAVRIATNASLVSAPSLQILNIPYAIYNLTNNNNRYPIKLVDDAGNGGYVFNINSDLYQNNALISCINKALKAWQCQSNINFSIGESTMTNALAMDGINAILMDDSIITSNALALNYNYFSGCNGGNTWILKETDIVINSNFIWNYTNNLPLSTEFDLESVLLHEFGHGFLQGHITDIGNFMHFSIPVGVDLRNFDISKNVEGVMYEQNYSALTQACNKPKYNALLNCALGNKLEKNEMIVVYPNPVTESLFISNLNVKSMTYSIINTLGIVVSKNIIFSENQNYIDVSHLPTGMYWLYIKTDEKLLAKKFVKQ